MTDTTAVPLFFNPFDPEFRANPHPLFKRMREEEPIHRTAVGSRLFTRHADIVNMLRHPAMSSDGSNASLLGTFLNADTDQSNAIREQMDQVLLFRDPPDHTRLRGLMNKAFTPRVVEALRPKISQLVDELLTKAEGEDEIDVIADLSYPLPVIVIAEMLGVPIEDREKFQEWSQALARMIDPLRNAERNLAAERAAAEMRDYYEPLMESRRREPADDLVSALIAAEEAGDRLTTDELFANTTLLLIAGHETTMNLIGNGMLALLRNRDQLERWQSDPDRYAKPGVEELLRYEGTVTFTVRHAAEDVEVAGEQIKKGESSILALLAANRDPAVFADPDRLDIGREDNRHIALGFGIHFCLGAPLARAEAQITITELLRRFPKIDLAEEPEWRDTLTLRGLTGLRVSLR